MKKLTLAVTVMVATLISGAAFGGVAGTAHDFSTNTTWMVDTPNDGEICAPCHTPHQALTNTVPLWNHAPSANAGSFTPYPSGAGTTMAATPGQPSGVSLMCLGCHDGSVALAAYGADAGSPTNSTTIASGALVGSGGDMSLDHPISFAYADSTGDTYIKATTASVPSGGTIADLLTAGNMECSSCHDVHAQDGDAATADGLLIVDNAGSALCLTCHDK